MKSILNRVGYCTIFAAVMLLSSTFAWAQVPSNPPANSQACAAAEQAKSDASAVDPKTIVQTPEKDAAAKKLFMQADLSYDIMMRIKIYDPAPDDLNRDNVEKKINLMQDEFGKAVKIYNQIINESESHLWSVSSMARMGMMMQHFGEEYANIKPPKGLSKEETAAYQSKMQSISEKFMENALNLYMGVHYASADLKVNNDIIADAEKRLAALQKK